MYMYLAFAPLFPHPPAPGRSLLRADSERVQALAFELAARFEANCRAVFGVVSATPDTPVDC